MRYERMNLDWVAAIRSFLPNKLREPIPVLTSVVSWKVSLGSCSQVLPSAICRKPAVPYHLL